MASISASNNFRFSFLFSFASEIFSEEISIPCTTLKCLLKLSECHPFPHPRSKTELLDFKDKVEIIVLIKSLASFLFLDLYSIW